jgi:hypothetical protein
LYIPLPYPSCSSHLTFDKNKTPFNPELVSLSMDRLISSPHPTPALLRPRLHPSRAYVAPKLPPRFFSRRTSRTRLLFSKHEGPPPVSLNVGLPLVSPELKDEKTDACIESPVGRLFSSSGFRKVPFSVS